jgi:putative ABC transport system ATP-binding protein
VTSSVLNIHDVTFQWPGRTGFSLSIPAFSLGVSETVLLLGESGSGKSTLLSLICGTLLPDAGTVEVAGQDITRLSGGKRDRFRAEHIGVIFQQFNLLPFATVVDNITLPLQFAPDRHRRAGRAKEQALELCTSLGLPASLMSAKAQTLSVGQQQRVAVARALIGAPPLIVADEPTSALDATSQSAFLDLLFDQVHGQKAALLMGSHDPRLAKHFDRVVTLEDIATLKRSAA